MLVRNFNNIKQNMYNPWNKLQHIDNRMAAGYNELMQGIVNRIHRYTA